MSSRWPSSTFGRCLPFWIHSVCGSNRENTFSCAGMVSSFNSRRWARFRCLSSIRWKDSDLALLAFLDPLGVRFKQGKHFLVRGNGFLVQQPALGQVQVLVEHPVEVF